MNYSDISAKLGAKILRDEYHEPDAIERAVMALKEAKGEIVYLRESRSALMVKVDAYHTIQSLLRVLDRSNDYGNGCARDPSATYGIDYAIEALHDLKRPPVPSENPDADIFEPTECEPEETIPQKLARRMGAEFVDKDLEDDILLGIEPDPLDDENTSDPADVTHYTDEEIKAAWSHVADRVAANVGRGQVQGAPHGATIPG